MGKGMEILPCRRQESNMDNILVISGAGGCFTNISWALQNILSKFVYRRNRTSYENFKLKLCTCAQSHALGTHTKFRLEILSLNVISSIVDFREIILESSRNVKQPQVLIRHPWQQGWWGQHGAHLGPTGPRWAPCWPHQPCYLGWYLTKGLKQEHLIVCSFTMKHTKCTTGEAWSAFSSHPSSVFHFEWTHNQLFLL